MKFYQRLAYYLVGLVMGMFVVAMIFSGKDTRCNYFPNARVLNDLRNKPFHFSAEAQNVLSQGWINKEDVKNTLTHGDVDFDRSNVKTGNGKLYIIEGRTANDQRIELQVLNFTNKAELRTIIKK
ncbi:MAG TPA: DUF4258 domain-containing protein [Flavobacterium sp.]|jgi:hypothetical protein